MRVPTLTKSALAVSTLLLAALFAVGCATPEPPAGLSPVTGFEVKRYTGKWYEIARLDHSFERGLEQVSAEYTPREDGHITVLNRGYNPVKREWKEARGIAKFTGDPQVAALKVSFFGPFYGGYNVLKLDPDYRYSLVAGPNRDYLWILSRDPNPPASVVAEYKDQAREWGFPVDQLIDVKQVE